MFQAMIFAALLESGAGQIHAINERIAHTYAARSGRAIPGRIRFMITIGILVGAIFVADRIGLVTLIAQGYSWLSMVFLAVFVIPLFTIGVWRLTRRGPAPAEAPSTL